jgi:glycosyltransferase involved in cell wall biosynthesis
VSELTFTVFTPTFNRAHTLPRVYDSLRQQTCRDFEWLIVDNGSTDSTLELVRAWEREADFSVRYVRQENRGKHISMNRGFTDARGFLFVPLDSDDGCLPNALGRILEIWNSIPQAERSSFAGVCCRCLTTDGQLIGPPFPKPIFDSNARELFYRYGITAELWGAARSAVLRDFRFDESQVGTYVPESRLWFRVSELYRFRYFDEALRVYYTNDPEPSLARRVSVSTLAPGGRGACKEVLDRDLRFFWYAPRLILRNALLYGRFSRHLGVRLRQQLRDVGTTAGRFMVLATAPAALFYYRRDIRRESTGTSSRDPKSTNVSAARR